MGHEPLGAVFFIGEHVKRPVAAAEFNDAGALHPGAVLQIIDRVSRNGGAGKGADDIVLALIFVGDERLDRCLGFPLSMGYVIGFSRVIPGIFSMLQGTAIW